MTMNRDELKSKIKNYIKYCRAHKDELLNTTNINNKFQLPSYVKEKVDFYLNRTLEATTCSDAGGYMTPFAFAKRGIGNIRSATMFGYKLANVKNNKLKEGGQVYDIQPGNAAPPDTIDSIPIFFDKYGLPQHNDPTEDPALDGLEQSAKAGQNSMYELNKNKKNKIIKFKDLLKEANVDINNASITAQNNPQQNKPVVKNEPLNVSSYNIQKDFSEFDMALKNCTEQTKIKYQKVIQDKILGKKVVLRGSKGYKQPESDYTVNVTGVQLDYYYDRYVVIVIGREEQKQKTSKFFVKPGFKIKIIGMADINNTDNYQIKKSKALVNDTEPTTPEQDFPGDTNITSDNEQ